MIYVHPSTVPAAASPGIPAFAAHARGAGSVTRVVATVRASQHAAAVAHATVAVDAASAVVGAEFTRIVAMSPESPDERTPAALLAVMAPLSACRIHLTTAHSSGFAARIVDAIVGDVRRIEYAVAPLTIDIARRIRWDVACVEPGPTFARVAILAGDDDARAWAALMAARDALAAVEAVVGDGDRVGLDATVATLRASCCAFAAVSRMVLPVPQ